MKYQHIQEIVIDQLNLMGIDRIDTKKLEKLEDACLKFNDGHWLCSIDEEEKIRTFIKENKSKYI